MAQSSSVEVFNRDINPSEHLADAFPSLKPLIINDLISREFDRRERAAVWWKRVHMVLGRGALLCIAIVMMYFDFELTLGRVYDAPESMQMLTAAIGAAAVLAQFVLILGRIKESWIVERFAAERLRCLKFQAFALAAFARNPAELASDVASFTKQHVAQLNQELMAGRSAIDEFSPSELTLSEHSRKPSARAEFVRDAFKVYESIRLDVQAQHFERQARREEKRGRYPALLSELLFALGGGLAFFQVAAAARLFAVDSPSGLWLGFVTLAAFIGSAVVAVYQRGSADVSHAERYRHYAREIHRIRMRIDPASAESLRDTVQQTELTELRELFDFCRDSMRSSYVF